MDNNNYTIKAIPMDERPREKLLKYGANTLSNSELIAIILRVGSTKDTAITLAQKILNDNSKGLANLTDATPETLKMYHGVSDAKAAQLLAAVELGKRISSNRGGKIKISSPQDVSAMLMEDMRYLKREYFKIILLDTKNNVLGIRDISIGSLSSSIVHPREVFKEAINASSASIILVHNHPSGEVEPSKEDLNITSRIIEGSKILGINVLDHIIIGDGVFLSFKEEGYI